MQTLQKIKGKTHWGRNPYMFIIFLW